MTVITVSNAGDVEIALFTGCTFDLARHLALSGNCSSEGGEDAADEFAVDAVIAVIQTGCRVAGDRATEVHALSLIHI